MSKLAVVPKQPDNFWYSKIGSYQTCPKKYELQHIRNLPEPGTPSGDLIFGSAIHSAINAVLSGEDGLLSFQTYWESVQESAYAWGRLGLVDLKDMGEVMVSRFARLHAKKFKAFQMEERLYAELAPGLVVEGTPDFLGDFDGVPSVVDFKTSGYRYDKRKLICDMQQPLYAALAKSVGFEAKQIVYVVFIKTRGDPSIQTITRQLTTTQIASTVSNVIETCEEIRNRKTFPMNTRSCMMGSSVCPYFSTCFGSNE